MMTPQPKIKVPFEVYPIKCDECGVEFVLLILIDDPYGYMHQTHCFHCPFCGAKQEED